MARKQDQSTMTERLNFDKRILTCKEFLTMISSFILPLVLGISTVIITIHQQKIAIQQRAEDRQLAREQREQDLNISKLQREQDKADARLLREQDLNISTQQRLEDRSLAREQRLEDRQLAKEQRDQDLLIAQQQRELEKLLADERREQEFNISNEQREMSEKQRKHEFDIQIQQYRNTLLVEYIKEIGQMLEHNQGSLTNNTITATLARVKTLTILRQLDTYGKIQIIQFLYEAGQLNANNKPLDLSTADLNNMNMNNSISELPMHRLCLAGAYLRHSSFAGRDLTSANFHGAYLNEVNFGHAILKNVNFSYTILTKASFLRSNLVNSDFSHANIIEADLTQAMIDHANFSHSNGDLLKCNKCTGIHTNFIHVNFPNATFTVSDYSYIRPMYINLFIFAFKQARLSKVNFSNANISYTSFYRANIASSTFFNAHAKMVKMHFIESEQIDFSNTRCISANFQYANLFAANFSGSNVLKTTFTNIYAITSINFTGANLRMAIFSNTEISNEQLQSALSIEHIKLSDGSFGQDSNLILNGDPICNTSLKNNWKISEHDAILIAPSKANQTHCMFIRDSKSETIITMTQIYNMTKRADFTYWNKSRVILTARLSSKIKIFLIGIMNGKRITNQTIGTYYLWFIELLYEDLQKSIFYCFSFSNQLYYINILFSAMHDHNIHLQIPVQQEMNQIMVQLKFEPKTNLSDDIWCDNIKMIIEYDTLE